MTKLELEIKWSRAVKAYREEIIKTYDLPQGQEGDIASKKQAILELFPRSRSIYKIGLRFFALKIISASGHDIRLTNRLNHLAHKLDNELEAIK
jgi:hypothetical protein